VAKFDYNDTVQVVADAPADLRPGSHASVVGIEEEPRQGSYYERFPPGTVYLIEFEGGDAVSIHESMLQPAQPPFFPPDQSKR
jgi:hypothetical protein